jgi:hypothetical protein
MQGGAILVRGELAECFALIINGNAIKYLKYIVTIYYIRCFYLYDSSIITDNKGERAK